MLTIKFGLGIIGGAIDETVAILESRANSGQ